MTNEHAINGEQAPLPAEEQLRQERDRLQQRVQEVEQERDRLQQTLAAVQKERDQFLQSLYGYVQKECSYEEALEFFQNLREEDCVPFSEVLAECEQLVADYERSREK